QAAADCGGSPFLQDIAAGRRISTADVLAAELAGDTAAHEIMENVIRLISINLGGVTNTLDLDMIILGGGVVQACPGFTSRIQERIRDFLMTEEAKRDLRVVKETFANSALIGAAADVFQRQGIA
ncbi:MAG: ROK family protein, partial [Anaerolineaceae bacterium]|nr:ROK family protein [Anaerolineaceae bacterium]